MSESPPQKPPLSNLFNGNGKKPFYPDVVRPMPRRKRIESAKKEKKAASYLPMENKPSLWKILVRVLVWTTGICAYGLAKAYGWFTRQNTPADDARRLRIILTRMGPTAIKAGQQLSVRADMLPEEFCRELAKMLDRMPPFPFEHALELVEESLGRPLPEVFRIFDPVPIGSASISCVYQAELMDGRKVAVKVKRPGIDAQIQADLAAIGLLCINLESLGILRPGLTRHFRTELYRMITEELNFVLETRYTEIFRRTSKKNPYVSSPKIYNEFCNNNVIVSEFVSGVFLSEIIDALNANDTKAIEGFKARGFDFEKIGKRMMRVLHWECYETLFFHADPHPANLIVRPDNTIIMIDFGSCGSVSGVMKRKLMVFHRQMLENDVHGMSQTIVSILEPLPHIDTYSFTNDLVNVFRRLLLANESKHADWEEKCTGWMWIRIIELTRKYNIPINLDTLRVFRATFMYDTIIYRLHPAIDPRKEFKKWGKGYHQRTKRRIQREMWQRKFGPLDSDYGTIKDVSDLSRQVMERVQKYLDTPNYNFGYGVGKVSYVVSTLTRTVLVSLQLLLLFVAGKVAHLFYTTDVFSKGEDGGSAFDFTRAAPYIFGDAHFLIFCAILAGLFLIRVRKILMRLDEVDVT